METKINSKLQTPEKLTSIIPAWELIDNNDELKVEDDYLKSLTKYKKTLKALKSEVKQFIIDDPILDSLEKYLRFGYFEISEVDESDFEKDAISRAPKKIPPLTGGDNGKKLNKYGDYKIWKHILTLKKNVIFVTTDMKPSVCSVGII
ncbi:hypothetical protein FLK61_40235 [Paenalkalicoccus suaedae]|uniref:PIN like domain-containing protein n=1 Tax=Paenalkalicoccus suaedae TaxID=2592382 RepID=A0A859FKP4_9BACI|nr:hypothetical protein FLK61_40235 [Paenalkalicoccus suaedae]